MFRSILWVLCQKWFLYSYIIYTFLAFNLYLMFYVFYPCRFFYTSLNLLRQLNSIYITKKAFSIQSIKTSFYEFDYLIHFRIHFGVAYEVEFNISFFQMFTQLFQCNYWINPFSLLICSAIFLSGTRCLSISESIYGHFDLLH